MPQLQSANFKPSDYLAFTILSEFRFLKNLKIWSAINATDERFNHFDEFEVIVLHSEVTMNIQWGCKRAHKIE